MIEFQTFTNKDVFGRLEVARFRKKVYNILRSHREREEYLSKSRELYRMASAWGERSGFPPRIFLRKVTLPSRKTACMPLRSKWTDSGCPAFSIRDGIPHCRRALPPSKRTFSISRGICISAASRYAIGSFCARKFASRMPPRCARKLRGTKPTPALGLQPILFRESASILETPEQSV